MKKLKDWLYKFKGYHLWFYKNGKIFMTKDYSIFGKKHQRNIRVGSDLYHDIIMDGQVFWHEDCE